LGPRGESKKKKRKSKEKKKRKGKGGSGRDEDRIGKKRSEVKAQRVCERTLSVSLTGREDIRGGGGILQKKE